MRKCTRRWKAIPVILALVMLFTMAAPIQTEAASVKVKYKGVYQTYYKKKNYVYVNGTKKKLTQVPVFLKSGTYVGSVIEIFKNRLGAKVAYANKKHTKLNLIYDGIKLTFTNGSNYCLVNGKKSRMGGPAMRVKYAVSGKTRWVVPLMSVCDRLKVDYKLSNGIIFISEKSVTQDKDKSTTTKTTTTESIPAAKKIVLVVDAGHGGGDSGAIGNGLAEKNMTLAIVLAARQEFMKNSRFQVFYTRLDDSYPSLDARCKLANTKNADLFLCVHINSAYSTSTGTETLYNPSRNSSTKKNGITSYMLATAMQNGAVAATGFPNRGLVKRTDLRVLNKTTMPACLIEYGFISNAKEAAKMNLFKANYGKALYNTTVNFLTVKGLY